MREKAREAALARTKAPNKNARLSASQGRANNQQGNNLTFLTEEVDTALRLSPQTIMFICLVYIGVIVILHIFGKVQKHQSGGSQMPPPDVTPDASELWTKEHKEELLPRKFWDTRIEGAEKATTIFGCL